MGNIIWLAAYPKSGNTWLRAFIYNLIEQPAKPGRIAVLPKYFTYRQIIPFTDIESLGTCAHARSAGDLNVHAFFAGTHRRGEGRSTREGNRTINGNIA